MAKINIPQLKTRAADCVRENQSQARNLVLLFTGVTVALSLGANGLNLYLTEQIGTTGGLGGMGLRSVLQTVQTLLSYFTTMFTPFWQAGFLYSMICLARNQGADRRNLLQGFRRFGSILGNTFWQMFLLMGLAFLMAYVASFVFMITPAGMKFAAILVPMLESGALMLEDGSLNMDMMAQGELALYLIPMVVIYGLLLIPAYIYLGYHLRMNTYLLVEGPARGAFATLIVSAKMMKGYKWQMLKMDLSFWWYYLLEALLTLVLYLDLLLPMLGVRLPVDETAAYFLCLGVYGVLEIGLHAWKKAYVDTTYIFAYEEIYKVFADKYLNQ